MCVSCTLFQPINNVAENFAITTFNRLAPGSLLLFSLFIGFWLLYWIKRLLEGKFAGSEFFIPVLIFVLIESLLANHHLFWEYIHNPLKETTMSLISLVVETNHPGGGIRDLNGLLQTVENSMMVIFSFGERIYSSGGWTSIVPAVLGVFLIIPFLVLWAYFLLYTIEYLFVFLVVSALSPLLIMAAGFNNTRTYAFTGLKIILQSVLTVVISIIAMGITLVAVNAAVNAMHLSNGDSTVLNEFGSTSAKFCSLFALGIVSIFFQRKAPILASNIMGTEGASSHAGVVVARGLAAVAGLSRKRTERMEVSQRKTEMEYDRIQNKLRNA